MAATDIFEHQTLGQRVIFDAGNAGPRLAAEAGRLDAKRIMVLTTQGELKRSESVLAGIDPALIYTDVRRHVPLENAERAREAAREAGADLLVSLGGGSATGLAKAVALETGLPIVALPTTYAGSEATNVWGLTKDGEKTTGIDAGVLPATVIYDATLTLTLPASLTVTSGLNALAHGIDAMWGPTADPINTALATEGIRAIAAGLREIVRDPEDLPGRQGLLYGAYLAAVAFTGAGSGMHHKISHVLGGRYDLPHAETHAAVLPHVLAFNAPAAPEAASRIARALGARDAISGLNDLYADIGAPRALREHGFTENDIEEAAGLILPKIPASNPRNVTIEDLQHLLKAASLGTAPTS